MRAAELKRTGEPKRTGGLARTVELERQTPLQRTGKPQRRTPLTRKVTPKRSPISPASPAQRAKIKDKLCIVCGKPASTPMHLWPRGQGGCDDPLCVLPACWECHRAYDQQQIELLGHIVKHYRAEIAHAHLHANPIELLERLTASTAVLHSRIPRSRLALDAGELEEPTAAASA
jgi:hypothetical protein